MTYEYTCEPCKLTFDVVKTVAEMERLEACPDCQAPAKRGFAPRYLFLSRTSVQHAEFNVGLGEVVKNRQHRDEIAKRKGLVEVGNDFNSSGNMVDHFDKGRAEKLAKRWEDD